MTDDDLERTLRATLDEHARTVTAGPAWSGADQESAVRRARRPRWHRLAPIAATVLVLAIAGGVLAFRHDGKRTEPTPVATGQLPIPKGMQAVDALGVEIFVPQTMQLDGPCGENGVNRPLPPLPPMSCPYLPGLIISIARAGKVARAACVATIALAGERGCVTASPGATESGPKGTRRATDLLVVWPRHDVQLSTANTFDEPAALQILRSAHAVPVDRHGCAAVRDPIEPPGKHDPASIGGAPAVPDDRPAKSMSVCWYIANRLVAAATLGPTDAATVLHAAADARRLFSPSTACSAVDHSDAVILGVRYSGGGSAEGILRLAACPGRSSRALDSNFVTTLGGLADMLLTIGYSPPR